MISPATDLRLLRPFGLTLWTVIAPALAVLAIGLGKPAGAVSALVMGLLLGAAIMAAVYHAEILAHYLGEPFGTLVLAVAVTVIEVSLIVSIMLGEGAQAQALARDTLIAAIMITINAIVGICLLAGGRIHHEQSYTQSGVSAGLAMLATLSGIVTEASSVHPEPAPPPHNLAHPAPRPSSRLRTLRPLLAPAAL